MDERLSAAIRAACPGAWAYAGHGGDRDRVRVEYPEGVTVAGRRAVLDALDAYDWSGAAQAAWDAGQLAVRAITLMATSLEPLSFTDRVINDALWTTHNDLRGYAQALRDENALLRDATNTLLAAAGLPPVPPSALPDQPRILKTEIVTRLITSAMTGGGDPAQVPGGG